MKESRAIETAIDLKKELTTDEAVRAFDQMAALDPEWYATWEKSDGVESVYVDPSIEVKRGGFVVSPGGSVARTFNDAVVSKWEAILEMARGGDVVVVNAGKASRAEFTYDADRRHFVPCPKPSTA